MLRLICQENPNDHVRLRVVSPTGEPSSLSIMVVDSYAASEVLLNKESLTKLKEYVNSIEL